ncbi:protein LAZY 1-like [Henckelia pumila]|uniref:protein LAZY 1-like n=1 Tax=Henckelia pumila TaxID=405737 RepID=UPI003C6E26E7
MKLLGWMHRKFRQNSSETPKDFSIGLIGQPSLEDLQCYQKGNYYSKSLGKGQRENYLRSSFASSLEASRVEEDQDLEDEPSAALTELFHGFLAIGTLGTQGYPVDPATPTFSISVDHIAEKETQVTENELKLINDELEKVLQGGRDSSCNVSSGRNSHVSAGRISHCSATTLVGKPMENTETGGIICPLQSYLFGSAIELPDAAAPPVRKEHRTSLGELFQKTKIVDQENSGTKPDYRGEKRMDKESSDKSAVYLMKKILKKRMLHAISSRSSAPSCTGGTMDTATADKKLHKILQIFNRKVHPESSSTSAHNKATKNELKVMNNPNLGTILMPSAEDITIYPQRGISKESTWSFKPNNDDISGNELWVKTDADYLVLEL